jgi:hypothetical protein
MRLVNLQLVGSGIPYAAIGFFSSKQLKLVEPQGDYSCMYGESKCIVDNRLHPPSYGNNIFYLLVEILSIGASFLNGSIPTMARRLACFTLVRCLLFD